LEEHHLIIEAFRSKDAEGSEKRVRQHIRHVREGVMENIEFFLKDGKRIALE
jgi:DNA-binding GntR family transcriptional regulator